MSTSTIPAVIDALLTLVRARPEMAAPVQVFDGFPRRPIDDVDFVAIGGKSEPVADGTQEATALGNRRRDETYAVRVYCSSSRGTADQKVTRDRVFELMAAIESAVRSDVSLGGLVISAQVGGSVTLFETDAETAADGSFAEVSFDITIRARL